MSDGDGDLDALNRRLAGMAVPDGEASEVLLRLAEAIFPAGLGIGDPGRTVWPETWRQRQSLLVEEGTVDARGRLEARIRESEGRFQSLVEQLPAVVFFAALGENDNEVYVSPQIETLLGFTQQEWLSNPILWYTQLHPDDHDLVIEAFTRGVQTGQPFRAQVRFTSRGGDEVWILGEARLVLDSARRPAYFQGVAFDITPTKRAQEALADAERVKTEAVRARAEAVAIRNVELTRLNEQLHVAREQAEAAAGTRSAFLATMSHELRTPLNSVIVLAGLLADSELSTAQGDMVRKMRLASDHLLELINDVLEFSRLRAGHVELNRQSFDLERWIADTVDIVAPRANEKGLELRYRIVGDVPRTIKTDMGRLRQVLLNLLANAVKFTPRGHVDVEVTARPIESHNWEFKCSVRDTGVGIDPDTVATLFDEFRQADSGIAREFGGTGLGLAICRQLCELLGGRIWVDAIGEPGATVKFTWVADAIVSGPEPPPDRQFRAPAVNGAGGLRPTNTPRLRILVVDDDQMNQQVALLLLDAMGHRADVVASGHDAIAAVIRQAYDTVLMDVAMPVIDGLRATRSIRHLGGVVHQPYIVALTANALPGDLEACIAAGMDAYVAKPIERRELARALEASARPATPGADPARRGFDHSVPMRILREFGAEPMHRLLSIFSSQAPLLVDTACAAAAAGNAEEAGRAAHTLKSSAAAMGATGLAALCADLEAMARAGSLADAPPITAALAPSLTVALEELALLENHVPLGP